MVKIRRATIHDLCIIQQLGLELLKYEHERFDKTLNPEWPFSEAGAAAYLKAIEDRYVIIAFSGSNNAVGFLIGNVSVPTKGGVREIVSAHLSNLYVRESMRRQGVGKQLFEMFKEYCYECGAKSLSVTVNSANKMALDFYAAINFTPSKIILSQQLS